MSKAIGQITTERLNNDVNGNPRYRVAFAPDGQAPIMGNTRAGASYCYSMPRDGLAQVTWHVTPSGRVVFDNIEYVK